MVNATARETLSLTFDYQSLTPEQQHSIQEKAEEIRERLRRSAQDIWDIGQRLVAVRSQLKHGQFDTWLKVEFGWSRRTAYNFISVYEAFEDHANFAQLDIATSALYLIAAPSTPQHVRQATLNRAVNGEKVTHKTVRQALSTQKADPPTSNIIDIIPKSSTQPDPSAAPQGRSDEGSPAQPKFIDELGSIRPGSWYRLGTDHQLFCGDTASADFFDRVSYASLILAITSDDWDHDWIVEKADSVIILRESALADIDIEQLISTFSKAGEGVIFPWLPSDQLVAVAHRLKRKIIAGDTDPVRCIQAIKAANLNAVRA